MRIDLVYSYVVNDLRKTRNGFYPVGQFNIDAYRAVLDAFNEYFKGYSATQDLHDALSPFKAPTYIFTLTSSIGGFVTLPSDYAHLLGATCLVYSNRTNGMIPRAIRFFTEQEKDAAITNQVRPVTSLKPIAVQKDGSFQIYPKQAMVGEVSYLRLPQQPVYAYTENGRQIIYDNANSKQIEYSDLYMPEIIARIVSYAKIFLDEKPVAQTA